MHEDAQGVSVTLLASRQLGFGISGGIEAAIRAARCYQENMNRDKLFVKVNIRNTFNTVRIYLILEAIAKHSPELLPFITSTLSGPSNLQFADCRKNEPNGGIHGFDSELLKTMESELVLAYLDDITLGDDAETVLGDFLQLEEFAPRVGFEER